MNTQSKRTPMNCTIDASIFFAAVRAQETYYIESEVEDNILEKHYDLLVGRDFMQLYGIKLFPHKGDIEIDEVRLSLAQRIRFGYLSAHVHKGGIERI